MERNIGERDRRPERPVVWSPAPAQPGERPLPPRPRRFRLYWDPRRRVLLRTR